MVRIFRLMLVLLYMYITYIPQIMIINRIYEPKPSVAVAFFLLGRAKNLSAPVYLYSMEIGKT